MIRQKQNFFLLNQLYGGRNFIIGANLGPYNNKQDYLELLQGLDKRITRWIVRDSFSQGLLSELGSKKSTQLARYCYGFSY